MQKIYLRSILCFIILITCYRLIKEVPLSSKIKPEIAEDNESLLASGQKIAIQNITYQDILRLPKYSDQLGKKVIEKKSTLQKCHDNNCLKTELLKIKGIGESKVKTLMKYTRVQGYEPKEENSSQ